MPSRPLLILGNIIAITVTIAAYAGALSWTVAGILILAALFFPLLANIALSRPQTRTHPPAMQPTTVRHSYAETKPQHKTNERHPSSNHQSMLKAEQRPTPRQQAVKPESQSAAGAGVFSIDGAKPIPPKDKPPPRLPPIKQGPNLNPTIPKGDYAEYDVELEAGGDFLGEATANGLINVYLLDEDNLDNLDEGEEFWSETCEEGVESTKLEFTAPSRGKWFFVVENADDRAINASVKIQKGLTRATPT